jgi:hypothetical protein
MIQGLMWILGSYGFCILLVHLLNGSIHKKRDKVVHYVFVTRDNQNEIEGRLRSIFIAAWLSGRSLKVTILDEASQDETLAIAGRLSIRNSMEIRHLQQPEDMQKWIANQPNEELIVIPLNSHEHSSGQSLLH